MRRLQRRRWSTNRKYYFVPRGTVAYLETFCIPKEALQSQRSSHVGLLSIIAIPVTPCETTFASYMLPSQLY